MDVILSILMTTWLNGAIIGHEEVLSFALNPGITLEKCEEYAKEMFDREFEVRLGDDIFKTLIESSCYEAVK